MKTIVHERYAAVARCLSGEPPKSQVLPFKKPAPSNSGTTPGSGTAAELRLSLPTTQTQPPQSWQQVARLAASAELVDSIGTLLAMAALCAVAYLILGL